MTNESTAEGRLLAELVLDRMSDDERSRAAETFAASEVNNR